MLDIIFMAILGKMILRKRHEASLFYPDRRFDEDCSHLCTFTRDRW